MDNQTPNTPTSTAPAAPTSAPTAEANTPKNLQFQFTGTGSEYFKIWIVNALLILVTLGLYMPWAKVRKKKYFYGNLSLDGDAFEYLADPWVIFRGYLIAMSVLIGYYVLSYLEPTAGAIAPLFLLPLYPWLIVRSMRFNAVMSSWRGLRFNFTGTTGHVVKEFLIMLGVYMLTLGLAFPYIIYRWNKFMVDHHEYGISNFRHDAGAGLYFKNIYTLIAATIGAVIVGGIVISLITKVFQSALLDISIFAPTAIGVIGYIFGYFVFVAMFQGILFKLIYGNSSIANNIFTNNMSLKSWTLLAFKNAFFLVITLGLYFPWAVISIAKLKAQSTHVEANNLNDFIAHKQQNDSALGQELGQAFDFDLGL